MSSSLQRIGITCVLIGAVLLGIREWRVMPDGQTHVYILDVGQGDSIFIRGPTGRQVLIDGGPDLSALEGIGTRMSAFDRSIDLLVLSHPHLDHVASFPEILRRYDVKAVLLTGVAYEMGTYQEFFAILKEKQIPLIIADPHNDIAIDRGLLLDVLWPKPEFFGQAFDGDMNDNSVVMKVIYGEDSMLLAGDMEEVEEGELLGSGTDVSADILKVGHHGSRSSTSTGFLLAVDPDLAVISAGKDNDFGHPHAVTLQRLKHFGIPVRVTAQEGTIEMEMDGEKGM